MRNGYSIFIEPALKPLYAKVLDRLFLCESQYIPAFTEFYDPAKWAAFLDAVKRENTEVQAVAFGGVENCERRMLGFFPLAYEPQNSDFPIVRLRISHNAKFNKTPRHQDYLGAILGLGLDRRCIGDIFISNDDDFSEVFVSEDISGYIYEQLKKVGSVPVSARLISGDEMGLIKPQEAEEQLNVASLRLDAVAAAMFRLSRGKVAAFIDAEKVFVNWTACTEAGKQLKSGDILSLRGYGRGRIGEIIQKTKKGRLRLAIYKAK